MRVAMAQRRRHEVQTDGLQHDVTQVASTSVCPCLASVHVWCVRVCVMSELMRMLCSSHFHPPSHLHLHHLFTFILPLSSSSSSSHFTLGSHAQGQAPGLSDPREEVSRCEQRTAGLLANPQGIDIDVCPAGQPVPRRDPPAFQDTHRGGVVAQLALDPDPDPDPGRWPIRSGARVLGMEFLMTGYDVMRTWTSCCCLYVTALQCHEPTRDKCVMRTVQDTEKKDNMAGSRRNRHFCASQTRSLRHARKQSKKEQNRYGAVRWRTYVRTYTYAPMRNPL